MYKEYTFSGEGGGVGFCCKKKWWLILLLSFLKKNADVHTFWSESEFEQFNNQQNLLMTSLE